MFELRHLALEALATADVAAKLAAVAVIALDTPLACADVMADPGTLPGRPPLPQLISPKAVPQRGLGSVEGRAALIHALAHIEFNAIKTVYNECRSNLQTKNSWQKLTATFDFQAHDKSLATH